MLLALTKKPNPKEGFRHMSGKLFTLVAVLSGMHSLSVWAENGLSGHQYFVVSGQVSKIADQNFGEIYILKGQLTNNSEYDSATVINVTSALQTQGLKLVFDPATDLHVTECNAPGVFTIDTTGASGAEIIQALRDRAAFTLADFQCSKN
jgi:hypothetical protein